MKMSLKTFMQIFDPNVESIIDNLPKTFKKKLGIHTPKIYLAHPISNRYEAEASIQMAKELRELGYEVYAAAENYAINDKTNNPTPKDIYVGDVTEIMDCDILLVNITGGRQDGTVSEVGLVSGLNEMSAKMGLEGFVPIFAYTENSRLLNTQHYKGLATEGVNHLVLGMIERWGDGVGFSGNKKSIFTHLKKRIDKEMNNDT